MKIRGRGSILEGAWGTITGLCDAVVLVGNGLYYIGGEAHWGHLTLLLALAHPGDTHLMAAVEKPCVSPDGPQTDFQTDFSPDGFLGPLALQEILLAGCPTVGIRTGASFVRDGVTGYVVEQLPPSRQCMANDDDKLSLAVYLDGLARSQNLDRHAVRAAAEPEFSSDAIIEGVIAALDPLRVLPC
ncbi:MAG: hypothetical protein Q8M16_10255 [Pirellulaceae bacterium]|nr:hypothetical protein [Pirellulaceae bacterium]